ncbi:MAG TPA: M48 family metalloprotease [Gammaproteobacteria bacterium]|nr:M48 family metalloprotease [Gammaproteobacteria bacterium]
MAVYSILLYFNIKTDKAIGDKMHELYRLCDNDKLEKIVKEIMDTASSKSLSFRSPLITQLPRGYFFKVKFMGQNIKLAFSFIPFCMNDTIAIPDKSRNILSDQELKALIAHEVGHIYYGHADWLYLIRGFDTSIGVAAAASMIRSCSINSLKNNFIWWFLVYQSYSYISGKLSQFCEKQADRFAATLLGEEVKHLVSSLYKFDIETARIRVYYPWYQKNILKVSELFPIRTHPSNEQRKQDIEQFLSKEYIKSGGQIPSL